MKPPPRATPFDSTLDLLSEPYRYISQHCAQRNSDVFEGRFLLEKTTFMTGPDAARVFYDTERMQRKDAAPEPLRATLFGKASVQTLDSLEHRHRKALLLDLLDEDRTAALAKEAARGWQRVLATSQPSESLPLYETCYQVLGHAVCRWAGVPLDEAHAATRIQDLVALFDRVTGSLRNHVRSRRARKRLEHWLITLIEDVRRGNKPDKDVPSTALQAIAKHRDLGGNLLPSDVAAVELLNLLRPTVAVSVFIVHACHALYVHPEHAAVLRQEGSRHMRSFVQEVRRYYPFFPALLARARTDFEWNGMHFEKGQRVVLDLFGTNHDPRVWSSPDTFDPWRFLDSSPGPYELIPQGAGDARDGHRCPGEGAAIALMETSIDFLLQQYEWAPEDGMTTIDEQRLPALPQGRFQLRLQGNQPLPR